MKKIYKPTFLGSEAAFMAFFFGALTIFLVVVIGPAAWSQFQLDFQKASAEGYGGGMIAVWVLMASLLLFGFVIFPVIKIIRIMTEKIVLADDFLEYRGKLKIKYADIKRAGRGTITVYLPFGVPTPVEQEAKVVRFNKEGEIQQLALPNWLSKTDFFEELQKRMPHLKIQISKPTPILFRLKVFVKGIPQLIRILFAAALLMTLAILWIGWLITLPLSYLGSFNFVQFIQSHYLIRWLVLGILGIFSVIILGGLAFGLVYINKRDARQMFFKSLLAFVGLYLLCWLLYYFGILR